MFIQFLTRSRFLAATEAELEAAGRCPEPGRPLTVTFEQGGYNRTVEVEISDDSPDGFEAGVELSDATRFPVRIRAAATGGRD